jgi:two-component system nitrogen regulation response regulator GlnG
VLQEQAFERVGGNETVRTDVRLIAATHRDLKAWSDEGRFRPDLYYRLGVFTIHLPPLRERGDDLPLLVRHFLRLFNRELGREVQEVAPEALERLRSYSWPGNVRELESVLKQALLQARGTTLLLTFMPVLPGEPSGPVKASPSVTGDPNLEAFIRQCLSSRQGDVYAETHRQVDRLLLTRALEDAGGNQLQAARRLGIGRDTLRRRLNELGIHFTRRLEAGEDDAV